MSRTELRILQTCFSPSWGGLEIQALEVTRLLRQRGHALWIACCTGSRLQGESQALGIPTVPLPVRGYFHPTAVLRLSRFLWRHSIDIIHCQHSKDIATVVPGMKLSGRNVPIVLSKRVGSYINKKDFLHRLTYAHISRVLAVSDVIHKNVLDTTPMTPDRVLTLHDAVDTDVFSPERVDRLKVRQEFAFSDGTVVVGFVGRFSRGKGHEELLNAAAQLKPSTPHVRYMIVGEASYGEKQYEQHVRSVCTALGLADVVTFAGFRKDIPEIMAGIDIFAFPSHAESFGVVLIEAMAMERPVVSTNCDGVLDIVVDGKTGLYVNPRRADELAAALKQLVVDPQLRQALGKAGRQRVLELFDQRKQIDRLEGIYYDLLDGR